MTDRGLPPTASVAHRLEGVKLTAPAAERNVTALVDLLTQVAPVGGTALELASGTGQHVTAFARACPGLDWYPTEVSGDRIASIAAYVAEADLPNLRPPQLLDATQPGWGAGRSFDLIVLINLLHLIGTDEARVVIAEAARALAPRGCLVIYGPFMRDGELTSDGDRAFHASLIASDPRIGYKEATHVTGWMQAQGLAPETHQMPANNLALVARRG